MEDYLAHLRLMHQLMAEHIIRVQLEIARVELDIARRAGLAIAPPPPTSEPVPLPPGTLAAP